MREREQLITLDDAIGRAAAAGTLVRHEIVSTFLEVLRLAAESQLAPDVASARLGDDGTVTFAELAGSPPADPAQPIRAACRLATRLFRAAGLEPPLALEGAVEAAPERFPTLKHLRDAFELELLLSGTPPPEQLERRMAIAALTAKVRQLRAPSAGPPVPRVQPVPQPPPAHPIDPAARITDPPDAPAPPIDVPAPAPDAAAPAPAAAASLDPPAPRLVAPVPTRIELPPPAARSTSSRWLLVGAAAGVGIGAGLLLLLEAPRSPASAPARGVELSVEIPLPPPDARPATSIPDPRPTGRERAAAAPAAAVPEAATRPLRKLRRRTAVADTGAPARAKLQLGDESLKQGRFFEAVMAFREALNEEPPLPAAARKLGDAYRSHQDAELAVAAYERYLELDPSAQDAEEVRAFVEELRSGSPLANPLAH